ncbi:hypothetical protein ARMSODRAFT_775818 [Armillaria solidipes]|uniref:Uncharacterized protein n=1 Tax=Armillaria solidipes TaxID=1076256 RepID=A0A2H3B4K1_9AGAR|nr:hypothetical protein ARMSODRAFT_775818 [Armillaria solidipes]
MHLLRVLSTFLSTHQVTTLFRPSLLRDLPVCSGIFKVVIIWNFRGLRQLRLMTPSFCRQTSEPIQTAILRAGSIFSWHPRSGTLSLQGTAVVVPLENYARWLEEGDMARYKWTIGRRDRYRPVHSHLGIYIMSFLTTSSKNMLFFFKK